MVINGNGTDGDQEVIYAIKYIDKEHKTHIHDPIVRNGQSNPFLPPSLPGVPANYPLLNLCFKNINTSNGTALNDFFDEFQRFAEEVHNAAVED